MDITQLIQEVSPILASKRSGKDYLSTLKQCENALGEVDLQKVDLHTVLARWDNLKPSTRLKRVTVLKSCCKMVGIHIEIPKVRVSNGRPVYLEPSQVDAVIRALPEKWRPLASFLYLTGTRIRCEAMRITPAHVVQNAKGCTLEVPPSKTRGRNMPVSKKLQNILDPLVHAAKKSGANFIFPAEIYGYRTFSREWNKACQKALGVSGGHYSVYILRHSCASNMLNKGVSVAVIKEVLGHSDISMTLRYAKPDDASKLNALDAL